jgi:hypothetical protein
MEEKMADQKNPSHFTEQQMASAALFPLGEYGLDGNVARAIRRTRQRVISLLKYPSDSQARLRGRLIRLRIAC